MGRKKCKMKKSRGSTAKNRPAKIEHEKVISVMIYQGASYPIGLTPQADALYELLKLGSSTPKAFWPG